MGSKFFTKTKSEFIEIFGSGQGTDHMFLTTYTPRERGVYVVYVSIQETSGGGRHEYHEATAETPRNP